LLDFSHSDKHLVCVDSRYLKTLCDNTGQAYNLKIEYSHPIQFYGKSSTMLPERTYNEVIVGWREGIEKSRQSIGGFWYWVDYPCELWAVSIEQPAPPAEDKKQYLMEIEVKHGANIDKDLLLATISPKIKDMGYTVNNIMVDGNVVRLYVTTQGSVFIVVFALCVILAIAVIIGVIAWRITEIDTQRVMVAQKAATTADYIIRNEQAMLDAGWTHDEKMKVVESLNETAQAGIEPSMPNFVEIGATLMGLLPIVILIMVMGMMKK
jgi:hypothetical protein